MGGFINDKRRALVPSPVIQHLYDSQVSLGNEGEVVYDSIGQQRDIIGNRCYDSNLENGYFYSDQAQTIVSAKKVTFYIKATKPDNDFRLYYCDNLNNSYSGITMSQRPANFSDPNTIYSFLGGSQVIQWDVTGTNYILPVDEWVFIEIELTTTTFKAWANGILQANRNINSGLNLNSDKQYYMRGYNIGSEFDSKCKMKDFKTYIDSSLVSHYKCEEGSGTVAYDSSGNGNHGTISGNIFNTDKILKAPYIKFSTVSGTPAYIHRIVPGGATVNTDYEIDFWCKADNLETTSNYLLGCGYFNILISSGKLMVQVKKASGSVGNYFHTDSWDFDNWNHVNVKYKGGTGSLSYNGILVSFTDTDPIVTDITNTISFGAWFPTNRSWVCNMTLFNLTIDGTKDISDLVNTGSQTTFGDVKNISENILLKDGIATFANYGDYEGWSKKISLVYSKDQQNWSTVPGSSIFDVGENIRRMEIRFKFTEPLRDFSSIAGCSYFGTNYQRFTIYNRYGKFVFLGIASGTEFVEHDTITPELNVWYTIDVTHERVTGKVTFIINNSEFVGYISTNGVNSGNVPTFTVGAQNDNNGVPGYPGFTNGVEIDYCKVWQDGELRAEWDFNTLDNTIPDLSGRGANLTTSGQQWMTLNDSGSIPKVNSTNTDATGQPLGYHGQAAFNGKLIGENITDEKYFDNNKYGLNLDPEGVLGTGYWDGPKGDYLTSHIFMKPVINDLEPVVWFDATVIKSVNDWVSNEVVSWEDSSKNKAVIKARTLDRFIRNDDGSLDIQNTELKIYKNENLDNIVLTGDFEIMGFIVHNRLNNTLGTTPSLFASLVYESPTPTGGNGYYSLEEHIDVQRLDFNLSKFFNGGSHMETFNIPYNQPITYVLSRKGNQFFLKVNDEERDVTPSIPRSDNFVPLVINRDITIVNSNQNLDADFRELVIFDKALTQEERSSIYEYWQSKWNSDLKREAYYQGFHDNIMHTITESDDGFFFNNEATYGKDVDGRVCKDDLSFVSNTGKPAVNEDQVVQDGDQLAQLRKFNNRHFIHIVTEDGLVITTEDVIRIDYEHINY